MQVSMKLEGLDKAISELGELKSKMPSIVARTLTSTAWDAKKQLDGWLPRLIDNPTPYTKKSLFVFPAEKTDLRAAVAFKSEHGRLPRHLMDSVEASRSMRVQVFGGGRRLKDSERTLLANGITTSARPYLVPAKGAKRDRYGNVTGAFMNKVLYTGVMRGSASQGYHRPLEGGRTKGSSRPNQYFVMKKNGVARGIYQNKGTRKPPMPVFLFVSKVQYKSRVPFYRIIEAEVNRKLMKRFDESVAVVAAKYLR